MPQNHWSTFKYYEDEPHQMEAVQLLQKSMPDSLLKSDSAWIVKYREKPQPPQGEAVLANPCRLNTCGSRTAGRMVGGSAKPTHRHVS